MSVSFIAHLLTMTPASQCHSKKHAQTSRDCKFARLMKKTPYLKTAAAYDSEDESDDDSSLLLEVPCSPAEPKHCLHGLLNAQINRSCMSRSRELVAAACPDQ